MNKINKRYNALQIVSKIYQMTLKAVPFSGIFGIISNLVQGLYPAATSLILANLFTAAYGLSQGKTVLPTLLMDGFLFVFAYTFNIILQFIGSITVNASIYERCTSYYKLKISEKTARLPLIDFENAEILNLQQRAQDTANREILSQVYMSSTIFITSGISIVTTMLVLASFSLWFFPISLLSVLPYFIARVIRGKEFYQLKRQQAKKARRLAYLWSLFTDKQSAKEMRVMGFEAYLTEKWSETRDEVNEELWKQNRKDAGSLFFCDMLKTAGYVASIALALALTLNHQISLGVFGACIAAFAAMQEATKSFLIDLGNMPEKIAFSNDYFEYLDLADDKNGHLIVQGLESKIRVEDLSFHYPNSPALALDKVSFEIHKGEKIVVLGINGSGKTTLSKLLLGMYPPSSGEIYYDGLALRDLDKNSLDTFISAVPQDFTSYKLTLRENIALSDLSHLSDDAKISSLLQEVSLDLPTIDEQLGREFGGRELSGGQWQKLAIARALFKPSEFVVLDEPTSALDPLVEAEILKQFIQIAADKTALIVSHRVGLCQLADRIIVMKGGRICEIGPHDILMQNHGEYYQLYTAQEKWYE